MRPEMRRRQFLEFLGISVLGVAAFPTQLVYGKNSATHTIDPRFSDSETRLINEATDIVVARIQEERVRRRVYQLNGYASPTAAAIRDSRLPNNETYRRNLLWHQLKSLSLPNSPTDTEPAFPHVDIHYGYSRGAWLARAPLDKVKVIWDGREWRQRGQFNITLNNYYVGAGGIYSDPEEWAGTMAHEMLHNLGHQHPDSTDPDYDKYQINLLDEVIQNNGYENKRKGSRPTLRSLHPCEGI